MTCPQCPLPAGHSGRCLVIPAFPITSPASAWYPGTDTCSFPNCGKPARKGSGGLCRGHYEQVRTKRPLAPIAPHTPGRVAIGLRVTDKTARALDDLGPTRGKAAKAVLEDWAKGR